MSFQKISRFRERIERSIYIKIPLIFQLNKDVEFEDKI